MAINRFEGKALGLIRGDEEADKAKKTPLHVAVERYLDTIEGLKKPNTVRKYRAVLERFLAFFSEKATAHRISVDDLNRFMVFLKNEKGLANNSVIHNMVIVAQFMRRQGRPGLTGKIDLPEKVTPLPEEYSDAQLSAFLGRVIRGSGCCFPRFS